MADGILSCLNASFTWGNYVSVDVGACFGTIGYIDFYISNEKKLALIDIHHNKMKVPKPEKRGKHDIYVLCGKILNPLS